MCFSCVSVYYKVASQLTLRDLRFQFAEQMSLLAAEKKSSDMEAIFRGKNATLLFNTQCLFQTDSCFCCLCFPPVRQQNWVSDPEGRSGVELSVSEFCKGIQWCRWIQGSTQETRFLMNFFSCYSLVMLPDWYSRWSNGDIVSCWHDIKPKSAVWNQERSSPEEHFNDWILLECIKIRIQQENI